MNFNKLYSNNLVECSLKNKMLTATCLLPTQVS